MDRYVIISTTSEQSGAVKASDALECAGIPVIVQHEHKESTNGRIANYKVLVPDQYSSKAGRIIGPATLIKY